MSQATPPKPSPDEPAQPIYMVSVLLDVGMWSGVWTGKEIRMEPQCKIVCESPSREYAELVFKRLAGLADETAPKEK